MSFGKSSSLSLPSASRISRSARSVKKIVSISPPPRDYLATTQSLQADGFRRSSRAHLLFCARDTSVDEVSLNCMEVNNIFELFTTLLYTNTQ